MNVSRDRMLWVAEGLIASLDQAKSYFASGPIKRIQSISER